ncbi:hypothetical protein B9Z19DRAFT_257884 [Tuber borchii]|uniref:Uncharacterized protein n=1 Tax=Tuber borchii TaxID=42251 RepID=A0A2T6ZLJ3_TUBBO|nr:hypothetical protein B9Z19DRAFT_257884 [Tuber borchii]
MATAAGCGNIPFCSSVSLLRGYRFFSLYCVDLYSTLILLSGLLSICFYDSSRASYVASACAALTFSWAHDSSAFFPITAQLSDSFVVYCHSEGRRFQAFHLTGSTTWSCRSDLEYPLTSFKLRTESRQTKLAPFVKQCSEGFRYYSFFLFKK